jgi:hypothetical protein
MGVAGFVISLVGILTCGLLSPIGLIFSLIGLGRQPKGLAIAGTVISGLGLLGLVASIYFVKPVVTTVVDSLKHETAISAYEREHGELPDEQDALGILGDARDGWGTPLRYVRTGDGYKLLSAGPDRSFDTADDIDLHEALSRR